MILPFGCRNYIAFERKANIDYKVLLLICFGAKKGYQYINFLNVY